MSRLDHLVAATRERVADRKTARPFADLEAVAATAPEPRPFAETLARSGTSLIAEHKRRSPSAGTIRDDLTIEAVVGAYEAGGAAALSILTEEAGFGGSLADLEAARAASALPILRKDFTLDPYQLYEARAFGADAILLIVAALEQEALAELHAEARMLDLDVMVEVHCESELERALEIDADVIAINNRDLADFTVDLRTTFDLLPEIPAGKTVVSESGIASRSDIERLEGIGVDAVLVGEALMRASDLEAGVRELACPAEAEG